MTDSANPELQRLLATLNGYVPSPQPTEVNTAQHNSLRNRGSHSVPDQYTQVPAIPGLGFLPPEPLPPAVTKPQTPPTNFTSSKLSQAANVTAINTNTPSTKSRLDSPVPNTPDASTITTWPAAMKYVTKHLANDEKVSTRILHLIAEQHKHERQWWEGREALAAVHRSRTGTSAQVSALLRSLGGKDALSAPSDPKENQAELDGYDAKVYKSLTSLAADFDRQLRALGIPFFAIKHDLVILEEGKERPDAAKGRLDKGELRELQKRMLQHLEDLFGD